MLADRGMFSAFNIDNLNKKNLLYILGTRRRKVNRIKKDILSHGGRFKEVHPERKNTNAPTPLMVKEVWQEGKRYIVCLNTRQARKDAAARDAIIDALK